MKTEEIFLQLVKGTIEIQENSQIRFLVISADQEMVMGNFIGFPTVLKTIAVIFGKSVKRMLGQVIFFEKFTLNKAGGSTEDDVIDSVSGASMTSGAVVNAVNAALDFVSDRIG